MNFKDLGLSQKVLDAVEACGYTEPTPIQAQAIPHVLSRRDLVGIAQTGTGKTASFVLPMLTALESGRARARMPRTLILEPTRELAAQVEDNFIRYGANHKLTVALLIGGVSIVDQFRKLDRGADVLIATPGRMLDHFERGKLLLTGVDILVIDEADRMLDMGFIPDIERICKLLPFTRQTLFFSATMPPEISRLADRFLSNPVQIEASRPASAPTTVSQFMVKAGREPAEKRATLRALIKNAENLTNAIIFCNRKRDVATLLRSMTRHGLNAGALHGDMDQRARMATLEGFRNNEITFLVASDVAARGLDIPAVSHIYNFDVPTHAEDYVHRIGRTGRAGRSGTAVTIATDLDRKYMTAIQKLTGQEIALLEIEVGEERAKAFRKGKPARKSSEKPAGRARAADQSPVAAAPVPESPVPPAPVAASPVAASPVATTPVQVTSLARDDSSKTEAKPVAAARTAAKPKANRPAKSPQKDGSKRGKRRDGGDSEKVIGLGDHVPQFLLRPVRFKESTG